MTTSPNRTYALLCLEAGEISEGIRIWKDIKIKDSPPQDVLRRGGEACFLAKRWYPAFEAFQLAGAKDKMESLGDAAMLKPTEDLFVAALAFQFAGAKDKLNRVADQLKVADKLDQAIDAYAAAGNETGLFEVSQICLKKNDPNRAFKALEMAGERSWLIDFADHLRREVKEDKELPNWVSLSNWFFWAKSAYRAAQADDRLLDALHEELEWIFSQSGQHDHRLSSLLKEFMALGVALPIDRLKSLTCKLIASQDDRQKERAKRICEVIQAYSQD